METFRKLTLVMDVDKPNNQRIKEGGERDYLLKAYEIHVLYVYDKLVVHQNLNKQVWDIWLCVIALVVWVQPTPSNFHLPLFNPESRNFN